MVRQIFKGKNLELPSTGEVLDEFQISYETWGRPVGCGAKTVVINQCIGMSPHAKSSDYDPSRGWWESFIGPGLAVDTNTFTVICMDQLGGCNGTIGPSSQMANGTFYGRSFPRITVDDMAYTQIRLLDHLGIDKLHASIGVSFGGMLSLMMGKKYPTRLSRIASLMCPGRSHPSAIAWRHAQRRALQSDPKWFNGDYLNSGTWPTDGMRLARLIGFNTLRSTQEWSHRFGHTRADNGKKPSITEADFEIEKYLEHNANKWAAGSRRHRLVDPNTFIYHSLAMDAFTLEEGEPHGRLDDTNLIDGVKVGGLKDIPSLIIGSTTDIVHPIEQIRELARSLQESGNSKVVFYEISSSFGHDAFIKDVKGITPALKGHLEFY